MNSYKYTLAARGKRNLVKYLNSLLYSYGTHLVVCITIIRQRFHLLQRQLHYMELHRSSLCQSGGLRAWHCPIVVWSHTWYTNLDSRVQRDQRDSNRTPTPTNELLCVLLEVVCESMQKTCACEHFALANPAQLKSWLSISSSGAVVQCTCLHSSRSWSHTARFAFVTAGSSLCFGPFVQPLLTALFPLQKSSKNWILVFKGWTLLP